MANIKFSQFTNDTNPNSSSFFVGYNSVSNLNVRVSKANLLTSLGAITGTGTTNYLPKFTGASALGNSLFYDNGTAIGLGTITPLGLLHLYQSAATTRMVIDGNAAQNKIISYRTNAVQRFGLYLNNTAESGANAGSDFAIRAYNDAGTLLSTPLFIKRSTGNVGMNNITPTKKLDVTTDSVAGRQSLTAIDRTSANLIRFTNPNFSTDTSVGLLLKVFPNSDARQGAGIIASGGSSNNATDVSIFATDGAGISYGVLNIVGNTGAATFTGKLTVDNNSGLSILASTSFGMNMYFDGATGYSYIDSKYDSAGSGRLYIRTRTNGTPVNALMFLGSGEATFSSSVTATGGITSTTGVGLSNSTAPASGIQFPATQVASANNNNLDDYEEGNWTIGVSFGGASVGVTYSGNTGQYTKVGRQVTVTGYLLLTNKGTSTGTALITGLPFTLGTPASYYSGLSAVFVNVTSSGYNSGYGNVATTTIGLTQTTVLGINTALTDVNFANNTGIIFSLTYFV